MNIWLLTKLDKVNYDQYDSCVVVAPSLKEAEAMHPHSEDGSCNNNPCYVWSNSVKATFIGISFDPTKRVICSSFNAG